MLEKRDNWPESTWTGSNWLGVQQGRVQLAQGPNDWPYISQLSSLIVSQYATGMLSQVPFYIMHDFI